MQSKVFVCLRVLSMVVFSIAESSVLEETAETTAIVDLLKVYDVYDDRGLLHLRRIGKENDGGYVVPEKSLVEADVVFGYGVGSDISFEDFATEIYGIPSYGFDCTCAPVHPRQERCHFVPSCIVKKGKDENSALGSFDQHLQQIGAVGKKIFVKMDIEGNEYDTMPDILNYTSYITGITIEVHFHEGQAQISQALDLLRQLERDFVLVHLHGNNCCLDNFGTCNSRGEISRVLELSYINRSLIERAELSVNQAHPQCIDMANCADRPDNTFSILR